MPTKTCHRTCSPRSPKIYTEDWPHCKSGILSAVIVWCPVSVIISIQQGDLLAWEMLTQRDRFTYWQLPISDPELILQKHQTRNVNHESSEISKASYLKQSPNPSVEVGDMLYIYCDRNKSKCINRYLVVSADGEKEKLLVISYDCLHTKWNDRNAILFLLLCSICHIPVTPSRRRKITLKSRITRAVDQRNVPIIPIVYHQYH